LAVPTDYGAMLHKVGDERHPRITRIAWLVCFAVPLMVLAILGASKPAHALTEVEAISADAEPAAQLSEEVEWEGECVEGDEEELEGEVEECEAEAEDTSFSPAEDCYLRTARAHVVAYPSRNLMRLTLGYATFEPARATVEYRAANGHRLGTATRNLGRSGVVRLSKHLGSKEMERLQNAHRFMVTVHIAEAPSDCQQFETEQLQVVRASDARITWSEDR
jgi:hypothetical protein